MRGESTWMIGLDEAGYGPNLGPLTIGATAWRVLAGTDDLYALLHEAITPEPSDDDRLLIADSKQVYKPGGGLAGLERTVLGLAPDVSDWRGLIGSLGADPGGTHDRAPWRAGHNPALPIDATADRVDEARRFLQGCFVSVGVGEPRLAARLVFPAEFNDLVDEHGTKGAALSHTTLGLARRVLDRVAPDWSDDEGPAIDVTLDKHGGRNRYAGLVQHWLPEAPIAILEESRPVSRYRVGERVTLTFRSKGEALLPVALASMTAKLLRELSMLGLNAYWQERVPGLKATAGYPVDAKRFKNDIAAKQAELGVDDRLLWRNR